MTAAPPGPPPARGVRALRAARRAATAWVDDFVPLGRRADPDGLRRARVLLGFAFCTAAVCTVFLVNVLVNYRVRGLALVTAGGAVTAALTPVLLKRTGSILLASSVLLSVGVAAIVGAASTVELQEFITLPWLALIPIAATMLAGRRAGLVWAVVCIALAEAQIALDRRGILHRGVLPVDTLRAGAALDLAALIALSLGLAVLYESLRLKAMAAVLDAQARLDAAREKSLLADRLASLGRMAAGIAHEINNPMAFVSSNVTLLREDLVAGPLDPALQREYVDDILPATEDGIRRVIAIVADLRRFAHGDVEAGVAFDLNHEVRTALRLCDKWLGECRVVVSLGELPRVIGRPREIVQVAMNLLINAAQAVPRGGQVRVETEVAGDQVVLRVADDGPGISPNVRARLFEPFFTTKPVGEGTGLGLAVVHGIVHAHGGSIRVDSEAKSDPPGIHVAQYDRWSGGAPEERLRLFRSYRLYACPGGEHFGQTASPSSQVHPAFKSSDHACSSLAPGADPAVVHRLHCASNLPSSRT